MGLEILILEESQLKEVTGEEAASFTDTPQSKRSKIQITLSKDRVLAEAKEILTSEVSNIQTSESPS